MAAIYDPLLTAVATKVTNLNLVLGSTPVAVEKRKLPTIQEQLDTLPLLAVVPDPTPVRDEPFATGGYRLRTYGVGLAVISAGNREARANLPTYLGWLDAIADAFGPSQRGIVPGYLKHAIKKFVAIDPAKWADNYDYSAMALFFDVVVRTG